MYVLALVKTDVHVYLYCNLRFDFDFHENKLVHESECRDLQADVHTENENEFEIDVEGADEEVDMNVGLEGVKEIVFGLRVIVIVKLDAVVDCLN